MSIQTTRKKSDIKLILRITIAWMVVGILLTFYDYILTSNSEYYSQTETYSFLASLSLNLFGAILGGITAGSFIVMYSTRRLRKKSFPVYVFVNSFVVSWRVQYGIKNNNCLNCFFDAKKEIEKQSSNYLDNFGVVPEFKAGLHIGFATVGEIELRGKKEKIRLFAIEENWGRQYE